MPRGRASCWRAAPWSVALRSVLRYVGAVGRTVRGAMTIGVVAGIAAFAVWLTAAVSAAPAPPGPQSRPGWALYDRYCLACHGGAGDGRGPAAPWLWPRPRDFTRGELKWRTTDVGSPPAPGDVEAAIRHGVPGTSMHGFAPLGEASIAQLAEVVRAFAPVAKAASLPRLRCGAPDPARGRTLWGSMGCASCHG